MKDMSWISRASEVTALTNGTVVTGDGETMIDDGTVLMGGGRILMVTKAGPPPALYEVTVVDVDGSVIAPGLINGHAHGLADTPYSASAAEAPGPTVAKRNRDSHLLQGCTTAVNIDICSLPSEIAAANAHHPLKVEFGANPTPKTLEAAKLADGSGLESEHEAYRIPAAVEAGAVLLGEVGSGGTLAGGVQQYMYVPRAIKKRTGREVTTGQAAALIEAVLGRYGNTDAYDEVMAREALADAGLDDILSPEDLREIIFEVTVPSLEAVLEGLFDVAEQAAGYGLPMMIHGSAPSMDEVLELADRGVPLLVAHGHHPTFSHDEALTFGRRLGEYENVIVEIESLDYWKEDCRMVDDPAAERELFRRYVESGLADTIATDFAGGNWHGMLFAIDDLVAHGVASLPEAFALATGNVAAAIPAISADRGTLAPGKAADVLVVDNDDRTIVERSYVDGRLVTLDGELAY